MKKTSETPSASPPLAQRIHSACHLRGEFVLRSGRRASEYFDKFQFSSDSLLLDAISRAMMNLIPPETEVLAGLELGAIPIVTMLSHHSTLPAAFVRKSAKSYGTARLAEGAAISGKRVLIVEDVATSGGQIVLSAKDLRGLGAEISQAMVVIDREEGARDALRATGIELISLFGRAELAGEA